MRRSKRKRQEAMPGQVWRFPLRDGHSFGFLRVVLNIRDIHQEGGPLSFVEDCFLVQVTKERELGEDAFEAPNLLIDGACLAPDDPWDALGYEMVGSSPGRVECVEFPCWFLNLSVEGGRMKTVFYRGEFQYDVPSSVDRDVVENRWSSPYLERKYPAHLSDDIEPGPRTTERFRSSDVRYHPLRDEILSEVAVDISEPYINLVRNQGGRLEVYRNAVYGKAPSPAK